MLKTSVICRESVAAAGKQIRKGMRFPATPAFVFFSPAFFAMVGALLLFACTPGSAEQLNSDEEKLAVLKVGNEAYSNVTVLAVTTTEIYFTHNRGIGNAKLEALDPGFQKQFHFDPEKAAQQENEQQKINANYLSWIRSQTNSTRPTRVDSSPSVSIEAADPTVEYKYYNLSEGRPEDIEEGMMACTRCSFSCEPDIEVQPVLGARGDPVAFRIESVTLSVALPMTITLPVGAPQKLKDHEEGHRRINEYFFAFGREAAEHAIESTLTNRYRNSGPKDLDSAEADFVEKAKRMLQAKYLMYTAYPDEPANDFYDKLTDHGRNPIDSAEAAEKAIQRYSAQSSPADEEDGGDKN